MDSPNCVAWLTLAKPPRPPQVDLHESTRILRQWQQGPFTMREMLTPRRRMQLAIWALISVGAALTGPFGTYNALGLAWRLPYWAVITGGSIAMSEWLSWLMTSGQVARRPTRLIGLGLAYGLVLSGLINALNLAVFPGWQWWKGWLLLAGLVAAVQLLVFVAIWFIRPRNPAEVSADPESKFLKRLQPAQRDELLRIESQDHYLLVVTTQGQELILMRLADAMAELAGADGQQVHRSHWVARRAMQRVRRDNGRMWLQLAGGAEVPVSRANQPDIRAMGLR